MTDATRNLLEQHFDTAFAAPDGIAKLRELILTLAMQGKLVEQDPKDPPASELLKEIEVDKKRQVKAGKIKKPKSLPAIDQSDVAYVLPRSWAWSRLGTIGNIFNGNSINAREKETKYAGANGLPYIATKDVGYGLDALDYKNGIYIPESEEKFRIAHQGAVLICAEGGSAGKKCGITEQDICFGNKLFANELFGGIPSKFILYLYLSPVFRESFNAAMTGIIGGVSIAKFLELPVPLPPLEEQHRIVARIDQLMARCDELEKLRKEREEKRLAVHAAAIKQLLDAKPSYPQPPSSPPRRRGSSHSESLDSRLRGNDGVKNAWDFIQQHFGELYTVKENVAELRKAILQLAVMGRLVPQDPNDPPASELLKEIEKKSKALLKIRKVKYREITENPDIQAMKYPVPNNWIWTRFKDVVFFQEGPGIRNWQFTDQGVKLLNVSNILFDDTLDFSNSDKYVSEDEFLEKYQHFEIEEGDLLFAGSGASWGKLAWYKNPGYRVMLNTSTMRLRFFHEGFANNYLFYFIKSEFFKSQLALQLVGLQPNFGSTHMSRVYIPIPPILEQHRIVARIDQLMALCDTLDQQIDAAAGKQSELLNAVMAQV